jgi:hypothetical protein
VSRLMAQGGHRRAEAIAIALKAKAALERFLRNPDGPERWLWVWRLNDSDPWTVRVLNDSGSPAVEDSESMGAPGYIVVNLRTLARAVLAAGARAA